MYKSFKEMSVWQEATDNIFKATENIPRTEDYGLTSQIRRAALSIPANISEAFRRQHSLDKINFYYYARGSINETQNHLEYGKRVGHISQNAVQELDIRLAKLCKDINKIIVSFKKS